MTQCTKYSRAWGCQCELEAGHKDAEGKPGICVNTGDGFWGTCADCGKQRDCVCHEKSKVEAKS